MVDRQPDASVARELREALDEAGYRPAELRDGFNRLPSGEDVFFISNPALGLWAPRSAFGGGRGRA